MAETARAGVTFQTSEEHPTIASYVWYGLLDFCGCGMPEEVLGKMRDVLRTQSAIAKAHQEWPKDMKYPNGKATLEMQALHDEAEKAAGVDPASRYLIYYVLTKVGLMEHGGSVPGWPTRFGEELLNFLESTPEDDWLP